MKKTILLRPSGSFCYYESLQSLRAIEPPLWLSILANKYEDCIIVDAELENLNINETINKILSLSPNKVIVLSTGTHPSSFVQLKYAAEKLYSILIEKKINVELYDCLPFNIIELGRPRHELIDYSKYRAHNWHSWSNDNIVSPYGVLYTSISCPYTCKFCTIKSFYGNKYNERPLEDVYRDLDYFASKKVINLKIMDELFVYKKDRVLAICDYIIKNRYFFNIWAYARIDIMDEEMLPLMAAAGFNWLAYGIESGDEQIRKSVTKGNFTNEKIKQVIDMTKHYGINCLGNYMFGFLDETYQSVEKTLLFAEELNCEFANFYCVSAFPESPLYNEMIKRKVKLPVDYEEYAQLSKKFRPLPTKYLKGRDVLEFRDYAFTYYFNTYNYTKNIIEKFGVQILQELAKMTSKKIERKYNEL